MARLLWMSMHTSFNANILNDDLDHYEIDHPKDPNDRLCSICMEEMYNDRNEQVMGVSVYQCGHALCTACVDNNIKYMQGVNKPLFCGECREPIVSIIDIPVNGATHQRILNEPLHSVATNNVTDFHTKYITDIPDNLTYESDHNRSHWQTATGHPSHPPLAINDTYSAAGYSRGYAPGYAPGYATGNAHGYAPGYAHAPGYAPGHATGHNTQTQHGHNTQTQHGHNARIQQQHTVGYHTNTGVLYALRQKIPQRTPPHNTKKQEFGLSSYLSSLLPRPVRNILGIKGRAVYQEPY